MAREPYFVVHTKFLAVCSLILFVSLAYPFSATHACSEKKQTSITKGKKSMVFKFEDYQNEQDGKNKLLELFPLGSDVSKFTSAMKAMKDNDCTENNKGGVGCVYIVPISEVAGYAWYVSTESSSGKITSINVTREFSPYYPATNGRTGLPIRK
jgi:hypothetical protein